MLLGQNVCASLLGLHVYTGCDSVSAFSGRGKLATLKLVKENVNFQEAFQQLGQDWTLSAALLTTLEMFTCRLYMAQTDISEVNVMRYQLFRIKDGNVDSSQLPPCKDSLKMHAVRANYQAAIWQRSMTSKPTIQSPVDSNGWNLDDEGQLAVNAGMLVQWPQMLSWRFCPASAREAVSCHVANVW